MTEGRAYVRKKKEQREREKERCNLEVDTEQISVCGRKKEDEVEIKWLEQWFGGEKRGHG